MSSEPRTYLMESAEETARLIAQEAADGAGERLLAAGLRPGMAALDVGCGPGVIAQRISELVGPTGSVVAVDQSAERVAEAGRRLAGAPHARAMRGDVHALDLPDASFDFVWSQFLFEYLADVPRALAELVRVTRPGGKIVICDVDGSATLNHPCPPDVEAGTRLLFEAAAETGFDVHVGRKLFGHFRKAGLRDIRVRVTSHYVVAGAADATLLADWETRFRALEPAVSARFGGVAPYRQFTGRYLAMLRDPDALKYGVLVTTEGTRK